MLARLIVQVTNQLYVVSLAPTSMNWKHRCWQCWVMMDQASWIKRFESYSGLDIVGIMSCHGGHTATAFRLVIKVCLSVGNSQHVGPGLGYV